MAQQTAVEWLKNRLPSIFEHDHDDFYKRIFEQAKQMEKEQIMKSFKSARIPYKYDADLRLNGFEDAEQYYNQTYGKE